MTNINRIERGARVLTQDGDLGEVYQVIVDPDTKELTHVVVAVTGGERLMIPSSMIANADDHTVTLDASRSSLEGMADQLRYNEADFQPVDPDSVERPGATPTHGGQTIVEADSSTVVAGSGTSGMDYSETQTTGTTITTSETYETASAPQSAPSGPQGTGQQRKGKDLIGLPVMTFAEGEQLGKVEDILFDPEQNRVVAILTDSGGWFSSARVVPWQNIRTIGHDSIIVPDRSAEIKADADPYIKRIMEADNILVNTQVYTEDGRDLGKIGDLYVDDSTGEVVGYEVSGGMFSSTLKGKKFMPAPDTLTVGRDVAFVPDEVGDAMQQQTGGLQGAAQDLGSTAGGALSTAREKVASATTEQQRSFVLGKTTHNDVTDDSGAVLVPGGKTIDESDVQKAESAGKLNALFLSAGGAAASGLLDTAKGRASDLTDRASSMTAQQREQQLQNAIGKTSGRDVYADDGTAIALQGSVVDYATVERARAYGKENQILAAVGAGSTQETLSQAKEGITGVFSGIRERIDQTQAELAEKREQQRINNALGRPVTRVILDRQDNVILETTQIVTHQAIDMARASGVLDILLDSVSTADPELSAEAYHSGASGQAAIDARYEQKRKPEEPIT